jgi:hypothetical protein
MHWYINVAYFLGGAFLVNAIPYFVNGVSGHSIPSPFASPPGRDCRRCGGRTVGHGQR